MFFMKVSSSLELDATGALDDALALGLLLLSFGVDLPNLGSG